MAALLAVSLLFLFRIPQPQRDATQQPSFWGDFAAGVRLVAGHPGLRSLYIVVMLIVLLVIPVNSLIPIFVTTHFAGGVSQVALMQAMSGVGLIIGGLATLALNARRKVVTLLVSYGLACALVAGMALTPSTLFWLSVVFGRSARLLFRLAMRHCLACFRAKFPTPFRGESSRC